METGNDGIACYRDMETDMTDGTGQIQQYERPVADNKEWVRYAQ
jgi:hypothetical protein